MSADDPVADQTTSPDPAPGKSANRKTAAKSARRGTADATPAEPNAKAKKTTRRRRGRKPKKGATGQTAGTGRGVSKLYPTVPFQDATVLADQFQKNGVSKMRRLTLFEQLGKSPDSGPSRTLVTNSSRYGLTTGGYQAEHLELTEKGKLATDPEADPRERIRAQFELAISGIEPFNQLYSRFVGNKLPTTPVLFDAMREIKIPENDLQECSEIFIVNAKYLGLLRTIAGAERILSIEHVVEETATRPGAAPASLGATPTATTATARSASVDGTDWSKICFYIAPIGEEESEQRKHSDLFLGSIVEPAIADTGLKVVRADQIGKPGMIGSQIVEHIAKSRLVIADLSFHNPNVFYELCFRHLCGFPTVQIIRKADAVPFDVGQFRTIPIDNTTIYSLVPELESIKAQIATQVRSALANGETSDNPIRTYIPALKVVFPDGYLK